MGGGFLRQMSETIKYNRDLLGKKRSIKEKYKDDVKSKKQTIAKDNLKYVNERLKLSLNRIGFQQRYYKILSWLLGLAFMVILTIALIKLYERPKSIIEEINNTPVYTFEQYSISKNEVIVKEFK